MKKLSLIIGLAIASVIYINAQSVASVASESKTVDFNIEPEAAQQILSGLVVKGGTVSTQGSNVVVRLAPFPPTQAVIPMPMFVAAIGTSNLPPDGYVATNFVSATFKLTTNGYVGSATFTKVVTH